MYFHAVLMPWVHSIPNRNVNFEAQGSFSPYFVILSLSPGLGKSHAYKEREKVAIIALAYYPAM
jgi:hypothetical protein